MEQLYEQYISQASNEENVCFAHSDGHTDNHNDATYEDKSHSDFHGDHHHDTN